MPVRPRHPPMHCGPSSPRPKTDGLDAWVHWSTMGGGLRLGNSRNYYLLSTSLTSKLYSSNDSSHQIPAPSEVHGNLCGANGNPAFSRSRNSFRPLPRALWTPSTPPASKIALQQITPICAELATAQLAVVIQEMLAEHQKWAAHPPVVVVEPNALASLCAELAIKELKLLVNERPLLSQELASQAGLEHLGARPSPPALGTCAKSLMAKSTVFLARWLGVWQRAHRPPGFNASVAQRVGGYGAGVLES
ncbi:hypothetical protein HOY80DRAFT_1095151 [Tuber brumale]|nr:hypothetical protein HOY80DRAFT_1095151 [Tuber brumale]